MERQLIPVYLILAFVGFRMLLAIFYPFFVLIHELGHAIPARLTGRQRIRVVIGEGSETVAFILLGIRFSFGRRKLHMGYTAFQKKPSEGKFTQCIIIGTAPVISLAIAVAGVVLWKTTPLSLATYFVLAAAWLANFHIAFSALWPVGSSRSVTDLENSDNCCYQSDLRNLIDTVGKKN